VITGTDERLFLDSMDAHIPDLPERPLDANATVDTATALDVVDFAMLHIDQPIRSSSHSWNGDHTHYFFEERVARRSSTRGQRQFADDVDLLFARNGIAFTIGDDRLVKRLGPVEARTLVSDFEPDTGDAGLDKLTDALSRFLSRRPADRQDALEKLWDAFERLKTLEIPGVIRPSEHGVDHLGCCPDCGGRVASAGSISLSQASWSSVSGCDRGSGWKWQANIMPMSLPVPSTRCIQ
jgi:hypothetical protein